MSVYEEIAMAHAFASKRQDDYVSEGRRFAMDIVTGFRAFLGCPPNRLTAHPPRQDTTKQTACSPRSAVQLDDDAYFRFTISLSFEREFDSVFWPVEFTKVDGKWKVALARPGSTAAVTVHSVEPGTGEGLDDAFRHWAQEAQQSLRTALDSFLDGKRGRQPVGFNIGSEQMP